MRNVCFTILVLFSILFLLPSGNSSGSSHFANQNTPVSYIDSAIENLIFNARFDEALISLDKAINQTRDSFSKMHLLIKLSEVYIYKNNPGKAEEILKNVALTMKAFSIPMDQVEFLYSLEMATLLRETGKNAEAVKWMKKSEINLRQLKNPGHSDAAKLYCLLGKHSYEMRDSINAILYFRKSIQILSENSLQEKMAKITSLSYLQLAYLFSGNTILAGQAEVKADSLKQTIPNKDHPSLLTFYLNYSFIFLNYNLNVYKAENALRFASEILKKYYPYSSPEYGLLYCYKGQLAYQQHDSEIALGYFRQAETFLAKNQNLSPYVYLIYFDLANTYYFYKNDFNKANENYRKVIYNNNPWLNRARINSLVLSGYCCLELGDTVKAITCIKNGISEAEKATRVSGREKVYALRCLAGLYMNLGKVELSHYYFQKAYEKANIYNVGWDQKTDIISNLANYHRDKGEIQKALNLYQIAIDKAFKDTTDFSISGRFCDEIDIIWILNNKGYALLQLYEKQDKNFLYLREALLCQKRAIRLIEQRLYYLYNENSEYNWLALVQTTYNNAVLYSTLLFNLTHDFRYADDGVQFAEKSRMMITLINSRENKIKKFSGFPDSLILKETKLHNEILNLQNQLYQCERIDANCPEQKLISYKLAKIQLEYDELKSLFERGYRKYFKVKYNLNVISLHDIQKNLNTNQVLIEYQLMEDELIILAIEKEDITMKLISDNGDEKHWISKFYATVSENPSIHDPDKSFREFTEMSQRLFSWLIAPVKEKIQDKHLIIIPHNELNLIPFELLISELPSSHNTGNYKSLSYLIKKYPVSYSYSATLLFDDAKIKPGKTAAFFIPEYPSSNYINNPQYLINLKGIHEEARKARNMIGGDIFSNKQANKTRFKLCAGDYKIVHIASHTRMDVEIPALSSLELTPGKDSLDDGVLYSYELCQLQLNAQLIVLSGCNTGMGILKQGEGLLSLSRSFFYGGARSVAYTLWSQADQSGADIMIGFYEGIKNKKRLEESLQNAKLTYLSQADPAKSHPYYWGGFLIVGKTDPINLNYDFPKIALILILVSVSAGGFTYRKFRG